MLSSDWSVCIILSSDWSVCIILSSDWSISIILSSDWSRLFAVSEEAGRALFSEELDSMVNAVRKMVEVYTNLNEEEV